nr:hypothetical protein [Marseillevirus cajuinensis]
MLFGLALLLKRVHNSRSQTFTRSFPGSVQVEHFPSRVWTISLSHIVERIQKKEILRVCERFPQESFEKVKLKATISDFREFASCFPESYKVLLGSK